MSLPRIVNLANHPCTVLAPQCAEQREIIMDAEQGLQILRAQLREIVTICDAPHWSSDMPRRRDKIRDIAQALSELV